MAVNPTFFEFVLVLGRRSEYHGNRQRRLLVRAQEADDLKITSFDSLAEGVSEKHEVTIGSRHNQFIDILTDEITNPNPYSSIDPTQLRVSMALRDRLRSAPCSTSVGPFRYRQDYTQVA